MQSSSVSGNSIWFNQNRTYLERVKVPHICVLLTWEIRFWCKVHCHLESLNYMKKYCYMTNIRKGILLFTVLPVQKMNVKLTRWMMESCAYGHGRIPGSPCSPGEKHTHSCQQIKGLLLSPVCCFLKRLLLFTRPGSGTNLERAGDLAGLRFYI